MKRIDQIVNKLKKLEQQKEANINRYILPLETKIEEQKEKISAHYRKSGINI